MHVKSPRREGIKLSRFKSRFFRTAEKKIAIDWIFSTNSIKSDFEIEKSKEDHVKLFLIEEAKSGTDYCAPVFLLSIRNYFRVPVRITGGEKIRGSSKKFNDLWALKNAVVYLKTILVPADFM